MGTTYPLLMFEFLANNHARISFGNSWLIVDKDDDGEYIYTVYNRERGAKRTKKFYDGHHLSDALWCLEHEVYR